MQAPIVDLPFDIFAMVKEDDVKLEKVSELDTRYNLVALCK